ncbi:MAG: hypothetical protein AB8G05_24440 [Oligoflexales bacterium]
MSVVHLFLASIFFVFSCNNPNRTNFSRVDVENISSSKKNELNQSIESDIVARDENGEVLEIKGLEYSEILDEGDKLKDSEKIRELIDNEEKVFEFEQPEGVDAEFSEPIMVSGSFLALSEEGESENACRWLEYSEQEPKSQDLLKAASDNNLCGTISFSYCIKMIPKILKNFQPTLDDYLFIETPAFEISLPCSKYSFSDLSISIDETDLTPEKKTSKVKLETKPSIVEFYLTNVENCSGGGVWQEIGSSEIDWELQWANNETSVFAKFKDIFGMESGCTYDTFTFDQNIVDNNNEETSKGENSDNSADDTSHSNPDVAVDNSGPTSTSINIDSGSTYATSTTVTLTLTANDVAEMFITNASDCAAGGTWESFGTSKAWTLGQTNALATVYVKFRDEVGNESSCINDTITHDNTPPTSTNISIDSDATYATSTAVSLTLAATSAADM